VHLNCVPTEEAVNLDEVELVHPRLEITEEEGVILWEVVVCDLRQWLGCRLEIVAGAAASAWGDLGPLSAEASCAGVDKREWRVEFARDWV
jgi:hypothetical protein